VQDVGYLIVFVAWGCGLLVALGAIARWRAGGGGLRLVAVRSGVQAGGLVAVALLLLSLALPWISGPAADGDGELTLSGWEGLDPLTLGGIIVLEVVLVAYLLRPSAGGDDRNLLLRASALCLLGLVAGNALIQLTQPDGSRLEWGALASLATAGVLVAAVATMTPSR